MSEPGGIDEVVVQRATHQTPDQVRSTRSHANAERLFQREYFGRFLIELLQNARDAWLDLPVADRGERCSALRIRLTADYVLEVWNEGVAVTSAVILNSIGAVGEGTKEFGASIGHKGIGFKSVLEVTLSPEIHSGLRGPMENLVRIGFDPERALALIVEHSTDWDGLNRKLGVPAAKRAEPYDGVPILQFPVSVETAPTSTEFDTVIRLPFEQRWSEPLGLDREQWVARMRQAIAEVSDEIVLLLGVFDRIEIEDELQGKSRLIKRAVSSTGALSDGVTVGDVVIRHDATPSSRWLFYERKIPKRKGLEGWTAVGLRMDPASSAPIPVTRPALGGDSSAECFHLFFPTHIPSRLPFLLHAYFQVDASRKGFADDAKDHNRHLLESLQTLVADAITDAAARHRSGTIDLAPLAGLLYDTAGQTIPLAEAFRARLLEAIDTVEWVPALRPGEERALARPVDVLADPRREIGLRLPSAFPPAYLAKEVGLVHPDPSVNAAGVRYLAERNASSASETTLMSLLPKLLRPGPGGISTDDPDSRFTALLEILAVLTQEERDQTQQVLGSLAGQPDACIIPVQGVDATGRRFVAPPSRREDGTPLRAILGRRGGGTVELMPPEALNLDLLADDLLNDDLYSIATRLGITDYTTDTALERMAGLVWDVGDEALSPAALSFLWRLLLQAPSQSPYGLRSAAAQLSTFEPGRWFWCKPGRAADPSRRPPQRREEALGQVRLPTLAPGVWRPAAELAFGADWADWLQSGGPITETTRRREAAYRDLQHLAPDRACLVAAPTALAGLVEPIGDLGGDDEAIRALVEGASPADRHLRLVHAFLLRLGVWEVPPLTAVVSYDVGGPHDPWAGLDGRTDHLQEIAERGGHHFGGLDHRPDTVRVVEDYRLLWPLRPGDRVFLAALERGVHLYEQHQRMVLACFRCRRHSATYTNEAAEAPAPSVLSRQLRGEPWLPTSRNGADDGAATPASAWWEPSAPVGRGLATSPLRFLRLAPAELGRELAGLLGITGLADAGPERLEAALADLRVGFEEHHFGPEVDQPAGVARQSFVGLHRLLYGHLARAGEETARAVAARQGVLAQTGRRLEYVEPASAFYLDRRSLFVEHFADSVPVSVITPDDDKIAATLGLRHYEVEVTLEPRAEERTVTFGVRPFLHDRAAALLALQIFQPLGGTGLELGNETFRRRVRRLHQLEVVQADNIVLSVTLVGAGLPPAPVGTHPNGDVYLDDTGQSAVLYHDLEGEVTDWLPRLRPRLGRPLATLLDSPAHADAFELLLRYDGDAMPTFLEERGITPDDLDRVKKAMRAGEETDRDRAATWWTAVCAELADGRDFTPPQHPFTEDVRTLLTGWGHGGPGGLVTKLRAVDEDEADWRSDRNDDGVLAVLAEHVSLRSLHDSLVKADGEGLRLDRPQLALDAWLRASGRHLATALNIKGMTADDAKKASRLNLPSDVRWRFDPRLADVLAGAVAALKEQDLVAEPAALAADALTYLAGLCRISVEEFKRREKCLWSQEETRRLRQEALAAWRRVLRPLLVAAITGPGAQSHQIRAVDEQVEQKLAAATDADALRSTVADLIGSGPYAEGILAVLPAGDLPEHPDAALLSELEALVGAELVARVRRALARETRQRVDDLRRRVARVAKSAVRPLAPAGLQPSSSDRPRGASGRPVQKIKTHKDQQHIDWLGAEAERWVLSTALEPLLPAAGSTDVGVAAGDNPMLKAQVEVLVKFLRQAYPKGGAGLEAVIRHGEAAAVAHDDDDLVDHLASFLHLSATSDDFGCDVLALLDPAGGSDPRPLLLEVKSVGHGRDRAFYFSRREHDVAKDVHNDYAIAAVIRPKEGDEPAGIELLVDPVALQDEKISFTTDTWLAVYRVDSPAAEG